MWNSLIVLDCRYHRESMKSSHWFKLRYSCVLISFQRVMEQKCSESSHIWVAWELKCFGSVKIQMDPHSQFGTTWFSPSSLGVLQVSPRPETETSGFLFSSWVSLVFPTLSLTLNFFLFWGLKWFCSKIWECEWRESRRYLFLYLLPGKRLQRKKLNRITDCPV